MVTDTPQWAIERAREELVLDAQERGRSAELKRLPLGDYDAGPVTVLARYIAKHEQPPVDPWEVAMRKAMEPHSRHPAAIQSALAAFRQNLKDQGVEI